MEKFNINLIELLGKIISIFLPLHPKHKPKELDEHVKIAKEHKLCTKKSLIDSLESSQF